MSIVRTALMAGCCLLMGAWAGRTWMDPERGLPGVAGQELPQPSNWVAFKAIIKGVNPNGSKFSGIYRRSADGSLRVDTTLEGTDVFLVSINSVAHGRHYVYSKIGWVSTPLDVPPDGWRPHRWYDNRAGLSRYPFKVGLQKGGDGSLRSDDGLDAYQYVTPSGVVRLHAPALNFTAVVVACLDGRRLVLSDIEIGEQAAELFSPPPGVSVKEITDVRVPGRPPQ